MLLCNRVQLSGPRRLGGAGAKQGGVTMLDLPQIRLEVERMRHSVIHAFSAHTEDVKHAVEQELERAVNEFNFEAAVRRECNRVLNDVIAQTIKKFFTFGEGREAVEGAVYKSIQLLNEKNEAAQ